MNTLNIKLYKPTYCFSGHIENSGLEVDTFTQRDINAGLVFYVHGATGDKQINKTSLKLTLQVIYDFFV